MVCVRSLPLVAGSTCRDTGRCNVEALLGLGRYLPVSMGCIRCSYSSLVLRAAIRTGVFPWSYADGLLGMGRFLSVSLVCVWCILLVTGSTCRDTDRRIHMVVHAAMLTGVFPRYSLLRHVISPSLFSLCFCLRRFYGIDARMPFARKT